MTSTLHLGDCLDVMRSLDADSVDAVVIQIGKSMPRHSTFMWHE